MDYVKITKAFSNVFFMFRPSQEIGKAERDRWSVCLALVCSRRLLLCHESIPTGQRSVFSSTSSCVALKAHAPLPSLGGVLCHTTLATSDWSTSNIFREFCPRVSLRLFSSFLSGQRRLIGESPPLAFRRVPPRSVWRFHVSRMIKSVSSPLLP